jgi:hypothetical protein
MSAAQQTIESDRRRGTVAPLLPLALLESMRAHDRPREVLEDENLAESLPRRLGLTGVVESQIHRYEEAARRGRPVPADEVLDLIRLVLRRPDAEPILREAGAELARRYFARLPAAATTALAILPRSARLGAAKRSVRALFRRILGTGRLELGARPFTVRIREPLTARIEGAGTACVLYGAAIEELIHLYTRQRPRLAQSRCAGRGEECCEWTLEE